MSEYTIVVGVDGSEHAARALDWAVDEATLRNARLDLVTAWHVPAMVYGAGYGPVISPPLDDSIQDAAEKVSEAAAEKARAAGIEVEASIQQGQAADALIEHAASGDLLVVGSRGHGGFVGLLLGSVSAQCAHHAPCPLVIVR